MISSNSWMLTSSRFQFATRWALGHLVISLIVAASVALLVLLVWYPAPWRQMLGVTGIFAIVLGVDLVCGPLLTLILVSPKKSRRERLFDLSLVALIQLAALSYGIWAVFTARPVAVVFEVDRLVVVRASEVQLDQLGQAPVGLQTLPKAGVRWMALRQVRSTDEVVQTLDQSLRGVTPAMLPDWWRPFSEAKPTIDQRAKPLADLVAKRPAQSALLESAVLSTGLSAASLRYLPLTSSQQLDWVALLDPSANMVGYAPVDGFD